MRRILWPTFMLFLSMVSAQTLELSTFYGFQFGSELGYGPNYIKIDDSDEYGISLGFEASNDIAAEITYIHHGTLLLIRDTSIGPQEERFANLSADWIMVGASKYFQDGKVQPYAGGSLGVVLLNPGNENQAIANRRLDFRTKFAFGFKGGVAIMMSPEFGLKLQANLLFPVEWGGAYIDAGPGGVRGSSAASGTTVIAGFSVGIAYRIGGTL